MNPKFTPGARVRERGTTNKGTIETVGEKLCVVDWDYDYQKYSSLIDPELLIRLRSNKRREFWIYKHGGNCPMADLVYLNPDRFLDGCRDCGEARFIKVREVSTAPKKPGKRITRRLLARAWDSLTDTPQSAVTLGAAHSRTFKQLAAALGLDEVKP